MSFKGLHLRFIRFLGPKKPPVEFTFTAGLNVLWGSSDTGKTFLVEAIDFMLGSGDALRDIPERAGYDRILLGITTGAGRDYTLQRSINGGNFLRFDGLVMDTPANSLAATKLNAKHSPKKDNNLSRWLLQEIDLDNKEILWSKETGELRSLGFRALAHLCVIAAQDISKPYSPIEAGQYQDKTREYGVFKLLLTGIDDAAVVAEAPAPAPIGSKFAFRLEALEQMLTTYEEELAKLTNAPETLDHEELLIEEDLDRLQVTLQNMDGQLANTANQRKEVFARFNSLTARRDEIAELQARFSLLDEQYSTDLKRLRAIEESGQFFVLMPASSCPLCGASPDNQRHDSICDGNVAAVTQAASAEIAKIELLQRELHDTIAALSKENIAIVSERKTRESELRKLQEKIDAALSPEFTNARKRYAELIEGRAALRMATGVYKRVLDTRKALDAHKQKDTSSELPEEHATIQQYLPKSVLDDFAGLVQSLLKAWHFPNASNSYWDDTTRDLVIGGKPRGSRGRGSCAITHSAFTIALLDYCRKRVMPHPGFVILDSPLLAYKEPQGDDENIAGTDLKIKFYEHLVAFIGDQQLFVVENTEPPAYILEKVNHAVFTGNPNIPRFGLFPSLDRS